jgi:hypothetical protein
MIVSIHVPKTAGTSFGRSLKAAFGERALLDYGDWVGFNRREAIPHNAARFAETRARRDELLERFDVIHGHLVPDKYFDLFPHTDFIAFLRDPYQQALSSYTYLLNNPQLQDQHPQVKAFHEAKMTIFDYLSKVNNPQATFLGNLSLESLGMIGLREEYARSVALFNNTFGHNVSNDFADNVNPQRQSDNYEISDEIRKAINRFREVDLDLYRRAREIFRKQTARRSV